MAPWLVSVTETTLDADVVVIGFAPKGFVVFLKGVTSYHVPPCNINNCFSLAAAKISVPSNTRQFINARVLPAVKVVEEVIVVGVVASFSQPPIF